MPDSKTLILQFDIPSEDDVRFREVFRVRGQVRLIYFLNVAQLEKSVVLRRRNLSHQKPTERRNDHVHRKHNRSDYSQKEMMI